MKRMMCMLLTGALLLCGCQNAALAPDRNQTEGMTENVTESQVEFTEMETPGVTLPIGGEENETPVAFGNTGCVRIAYNGGISAVRYITSVDQLPDNEALKAYDEAYFADKALVLVYETVGSGSVEVGIESIENGVVTLSHELPGDVGTADMATWLLWAEVEAGLDYDWTIANPAVQPNTSTH